MNLKNKSNFRYHPSGQVVCDVRDGDETIAAGFSFWPSDHPDVMSLIQVQPVEKLKQKEFEREGLLAQIAALDLSPRTLAEAIAGEADAIALVQQSVAAKKELRKKLTASS